MSTNCDINCNKQKKKPTKEERSLIDRPIMTQQLLFFKTPSFSLTGCGVFLYHLVCMEEDEGFPLADVQTLNAYIHDYLDKANMKETAQAFKVELKNSKTGDEKSLLVRWWCLFMSLYRIFSTKNSTVEVGATEANIIIEVLYISLFLF